MMMMMMMMLIGLKPRAGWVWRTFRGGKGNQTFWSPILLNETPWNCWVWGILRISKWEGPDFIAIWVLSQNGSRWAVPQINWLITFSPWRITINWDQISYQVGDISHYLPVPHDIPTISSENGWNAFVFSWKIKKNRFPKSLEEPPRHEMEIDSEDLGSPAPDPIRRPKMGIWTWRTSPCPCWWKTIRAKRIQNIGGVNHP